MSSTSLTPPPPPPPPVSHCIFCLKPTTTTPAQLLDSQSSVSSTRRRALTFLERHLKLEPRSSNQDCNNACRSCASTLESFCGLYEQIKGLELRLEGEVDKLRSVVEHANRVPTRGAWVKQCYQKKEQGGLQHLPGMEEMYTWRRTFSRKCLKKLSSNFPKVMVSKSFHPNISAISPQPQQDELGLEIHKKIPGGDSPHFQDFEIDIKYELPRSSPVSNDNDEVNDADDDASQLADPPSNSPTHVHDDEDDDDEKMPAETIAELKVNRSSTPPPPTNPPRWCSVCSRLFRDSSSLESHFKNNHDLASAGLSESQSAKCSACPAYFLTDLQLQNHMIQHSKSAISKSAPPPNCRRTAEELKSGKRFHCAGCPKWFLTSKYLDAHFWTNHHLEDMDGADVIRCRQPGCSAYFRRLNQLQRHRLEFHKQGGDLPLKPPPPPEKGKVVDERIHPCAKCGAVFRKKSYLDVHLVRHAGPEAYRFQCPICGSKWISKHKLDRHVMTHNNTDRK